jgi:hypothetical protein
LASLVVRRERVTGINLAVDAGFIAGAPSELQSMNMVDVFVI